MLFDIPDDRNSPQRDRRSEKPRLPPPGFFSCPPRLAALAVALCVGDREARADREGGELIDRIAAGAPVRKLLFVEALGHTRVPFARHRPDHRAGVELAAIDAHRAAKAAADLERRLDDGVAREARRDRFEIRDFAGRGAAGHSVPPRSVRWVLKAASGTVDINYSRRRRRLRTRPDRL